MDWAGIAVERASGMSLGDYCESTSFNPFAIQYSEQNRIYL